MKLRHLLPLLAVTLTASAANEVGFIERFALAPDREKILSELVPGTEDYYYFHALHYQNTRQTEKLAAIFDQWQKRFPNSSQRTVLQNREALLDYDVSPERTLAFLKEHYRLEFEHVQQAPDQKPNLPTKLDPQLVSWEAFQQQTLSDPELANCPPEGLAQLLEKTAPLSPRQKQAVLERIQRPNVPGLVELIAEDLKARDGKPFGQRGIHRKLLPAQLDQLQKLLPRLATEQAFVYARLRHLAPSPEEDVEFAPAAREAWLDRTWAYAKTLPASFNSPKSALLYQRLEHDRKKGIYDETRLLEYLKYPRQVSYAASDWINQLRNAPTNWVNLGDTFTEAGLSFPAIRSDEALVRDYFLNLFAQKPQQGWERFAEWVSDRWLKPVYAEALLVRRLGNPEQLASLLSPSAFQLLNERVDLDFVASNAAFLSPKDEVSLELEVKNAPKLIVKVYELNALNYFLANKRQLNTDLPLDGLVANSETTHTFNEPPIQRVRRTFKFPELANRRGAWIIEFIGGGRSSRALIRKGQWQTAQQQSPGGDLVTVLDEDHQPVPDAALWLDGRKFTPDPKTGAALIPFSRNPGTKPIIVTDASGSFATLTEFEQHAEKYTLDAQFYVQREQLLTGKEATVAVRVALRLGTAVLPLGLLKSPRFTVTTQTSGSITTQRVVENPKLDAQQLYHFTFPVPADLRSLAVKLSGKVAGVSVGSKEEELTAADSWLANGAGATELTSVGHLGRTDIGYTFDLLGRNGEALANRAVTFTFTRDLLKGSVNVTLATDAQGRIQFGPLTDVTSLATRLPSGGEQKWPLKTGNRSVDSELKTVAGQRLEVPLTAAPTRGRIALYEVRSGNYVADLTAKLALSGVGKLPTLTIAPLAPGDYALLLPDENRTVSIAVTKGPVVQGWAYGPARSLELTPPAPLRIDRIETGADQIAVTLGGANRTARVQITASRYVSDENTLFALGESTRFNPGSSIPAQLPNLFAAGRDIGDEYRYILERRYATKYPGNMLARPGVVLNPWETRITEENALGTVGMQVAGATAGGRARSSQKLEANVGETFTYGGTPPIIPFVDFLAEPAPLILDLVPDENGVVRLDRSKLGDRTIVQVLANNLRDADWREIALPELPAKFRNLRLAKPFDPVTPFAETKQFTTLEKGKAHTFADRTTSRFEVYDTVASVIVLYQSLAFDPTRAEFDWIGHWPDLTPEEKRAKYSAYACHELNVFLSRKDPAFFAEVIKPYLRNKQAKTFIDDYLLETDLTRYLAPWQFGQLNAAEKALLATRLPAEARNIARSLREAWELLPPNAAEEDRRFETALNGRSGEAKPNSGALADAPAEPAAAPAPPPPPAPSRPALMMPAPAAPAEMADKGAFKTRNTEAGPGALNELAKAAPLLDLRGDLAEKDVLPWTITDAEAQRQQSRAQAYFRPLGPAKEWAENNYYHLPIRGQGPELITVNAFWRDYAAWVADGSPGAFVSAHLAEACHNFPESMLALAVLDLPFTAPKHDTKIDGSKLTFTAGGPLLLVRQEILPAPPAAANTELLVSQNFYRLDDPVRREGTEELPKYVTDEFLPGVGYGAAIVVTNPTSSRQKLSLLKQIPQGAIPLGLPATHSEPIQLEPFSTRRFGTSFYFPAACPPGQTFAHYPVHVSRDGQTLGAAKPFTFKVVDRLSKVDETSWEHVSQNASDAEVFTFLDRNNIERLDLSLVAWRCRKSADFYRRIIGILNARHHFDPVICSYAVVYRDKPALGEWLRHQGDLNQLCGEWLDSPLLRFDPVERRELEFLEYAPLVNQRAHRLGANVRIANNVVLGQYQTYLRQLAHQPTLTALDSLKVVQFLFLQDRVEEALQRFKSIAPDSLATRLQYDYFRCYAAFYEADLAAARGVANQYIDHPVERWRNLFRDVVGQLDEAEQKAGVVKQDGKQPNRERDTSTLAEKAGSFDFKVENRNVALTWRNLPEVTVNYYLIDPEFSFSSNPFVSGESGPVSIIKPTKSSRVTLPNDKATLDLPLPPEFARANMLVEIVGAGQRKTQSYHANTLTLTVAENYGRLEVQDSSTSRPLPKAYVKVYARLKNGTVRFFKDGYTDLRGKFDYASLNGSENDRTPIEPLSPRTGALDSQMLKPAELSQVGRFSVLILSDANGATVREIGPTETAQP